MELKQLEFFIEVCAQGSFNQAAESLYTTQPNVSKVIGSLEKELGRKLFERMSRGIKITPYGETVREYAQNIIQNTELINSIASHNFGKKLSVSSYPSNMISRLLTDFYRHWDGKYGVEYQEGEVEQICSNVSQGISEIGIVYVAARQLRTFQHILSHKKLRFIPMAVREICVYAGPKSPVYRRDSVDFEELKDLKFIRGVRDFFSMEHHLTQVSLGAIGTEHLNYVIFSNSDHMKLNILSRTDVCLLGINMMFQKYKQYDIRALRIKNCEPVLSLGYVCPEDETPGEAAAWFLSRFQALLDQPQKE